MTTNSHGDDGPRSVETAWADALTAELPIDDADEPRDYADFLFGNPVFTMTSVDPDTAVVLVDQLLDRYPPMSFFGVDGALTTEEWAELKETLVVRAAEGVDGDRPGPASAFPSGPETASDPVATGESTPAGTESPDGPGRPSTTAPTGQGFAADAPDLDAVDTPTALARAVEQLVEAADLSPAQARQALELVVDSLQEDTDDE